MAQQPLHLDPSAVNGLAEAIKRTTEEVRAQAQALFTGVSQLDWYSPGRDQFMEEFQQLNSQVTSLAQEGDSLADRITQHKIRWEEAAGGFVSAAAPSTGQADTGSNARPGYDWVKPGEKVIGNPIELERYTEKQSGNTCAVYSQGAAMRALGFDFDAEETIKLGRKVGYYEIGPLDGSLELGKVWDYYGVEYESFSRDRLLPFGDGARQDFSDAGKFLIDNISDNKAVIVGVEFDTLYDGIAGIEDNNWPKEGHAVWVTGLITDADGNVTGVMLNDSIVGHATRVPIDNFMRAWGSKDYKAIASKEAMTETP